MQDHEQLQSKVGINNNGQEIFEKMMQAIATEDEIQIAIISETMSDRLKKYPNLPLLANENGYTLMHALCATGNLNIAKQILKGNEEKFRVSFYVKNKENKQPKDCVPGGSDCTNFKSTIERNFYKAQPSFCQNWILRQFRFYLQYQAAYHPQDYSTEHVSRIYQELVSGHCLGFSSIWAQCCLNQTYNMYAEIFHDIVVWDDEYQSVDNSLRLKFETAISIIRSHQDLPFEIAEQEKQVTVERSLGFFSDHLANADNFNYRQREILTQVEQPGYQYQIEKNWGPDKYQCENYISLYPKNKTDIGDYFAAFLRPENNGKTLVIYAEKHYVTCYFHDNNIYFFDSNEDILPSESGAYPNKPFGKIINAKSTNCVNSLVDCIFDSCFSEVSTVDDGWGPKVFSYGVRVLDLVGKKHGQYPSQESIELIWKERAELELKSNSNNQYTW